MLASIAGVIAILFGVLGIINPQGCKNRLRRRINIRMRFIVYAFILVFAVLVMGSAFRAQGIPAKIAGVAGLIITIKVIMLITTKSSETLSIWLEKRPLSFFRIWAFIILLMGVMLLLA